MKYNCTIFFIPILLKYPFICQEKGVWSDFDYGTKLRKALPNHFQIQHLELVIWTFEQIDELRQATTVRNNIFNYVGTVL